LLLLARLFILNFLQLLPHFLYLFNLLLINIHLLEDFNQALSKAGKVYLLHPTTSFDFLPVYLLESVFLYFNFEILHQLCEVTNEDFG
jgi:hypothetical protein